jgi:predicted nucleotidyltransferase
MDKDDNQNIPGMNLDKKYSNEKPIIPQNTDKEKKEMDKTKKELEKLKNWIVKKYPFTQAISILPPQAVPMFVDEEEVPKETEKYIHLYMVVPEDKYKEIQKIQAEIVKELEKIKTQKVWLQIKTPVDIFENCLDSKFDLTNAIGMSLPLYDAGFLGALRVAEVHKTLVVRKFEKYVVSYVIGGSLVRGEAIETSDVDVFVIINDTDVKRMPRLELKERLRSMIYKYVTDATAIAGVKNKLEPQIYLLTDFWESVKDAHPVMFTFIRDGIPLYDQGTFMPWKALLRMGKLKPSPEAIDMFMSMGDKTVAIAKRNLLDIVVKDIYWGVTTPSQAILMLNGLPPPSPKHLVAEMKKAFVDKEKMLEMKYINILDKIVKIYKDYEHERIKDIKGIEVDKLIKDTEDYLKRLKELRVQIEKRYQQRTLDQIYDEVFNILKNMMGKESQEKTVEKFEKEYFKKGKFTSQHLRILKDLVEVKKEFKKGKANTQRIDFVRKDSTILLNALLEFTQRCDLVALDKSRMILKHKDGIAELLNTNGKTFLIRGTDIKKIEDKIEDSTMAELSENIEQQKAQQNVVIKPKVFELLKKELGDFEIVL